MLESVAGGQNSPMPLNDNGTRWAAIGRERCPRLNLVLHSS